MCTFTTLNVQHSAWCAPSPLLMFNTLHGVYLHHPCYRHQYIAWCVPSPSLLPSSIYCMVCTFTILATIINTLHGVYLHHHCYHHQHIAWCVPSPSLLPSCSPAWCVPSCGLSHYRNGQCKTNSVINPMGLAPT